MNYSVFLLRCRIKTMHSAPINYLKFSQVALFALCAGWVNPPFLSAATATWDDGAGDGNMLNSPTNWAGDSIPNSGDDLVFEGISANRTMYLEQDWTVNSISFSASAAHRFIFNDDGFKFNVGAGGITHSGTADWMRFDNDLQLTADQTWSGGLMMFRGDVDLADNTLTLSGSQRIAGKITSTGSVGGKTLLDLSDPTTSVTRIGSDGSVFLATGNDFRGNTVITGRAVEVYADTAFGDTGAYGNTVTLNRDASQATEIDLWGADAAGGGIDLHEKYVMAGNSGNSVALNHRTGNTVMSGDITITGSGNNLFYLRTSSGSTGSFTLDGDVVYNNAADSAIRLDAQGAAMTINGVLRESGAGKMGVNVFGANGVSLTLNGNNTFTGNVSVQKGNVLLGHANAAGSGSFILLGNSTTVAADTVSWLTNDAITTNSTATIRADWGSGNTTSFLTRIGGNSAHTSTIANTIEIEDKSIELYAALAATDVTFSGQLQKDTNPHNISKAGAGTVRLTNATSNIVADIYLANGTLVAGGNVSADGSSSVFGAGTSAVKLGITLGSAQHTDTAAADNINLTLSGAYSFARAIEVNNINTSGTTTIETTHTSGTATISGAVTLNRNVMLKTASGGTLDITGSILGTGGIEVTGAGTLKLSSSNTYTGNTTVRTGGTLLLGANDSIHNSSELVLDGGTFQLGGFSDTVGNLTLTADSYIDFSGGNSTLTFAGNNMEFNGFTLHVWYWDGNSPLGGGNDQLIFNNYTLTDTERALFRFYTDDGNTFWYDDKPTSHRQLGSGEVVPVPEASTWIGILLLIPTALIIKHRKRLHPCRAH